MEATPVILRQGRRASPLANLLRTTNRVLLFHLCYCLLFCKLKSLRKSFCGLSLSKLKEFATTLNIFNCLGPRRLKTLGMTSRPWCSAARNVTTWGPPPLRLQVYPTTGIRREQTPGGVGEIASVVIGSNRILKTRR